MLTEFLAGLEQLAPVAALRSSRWTYASVNAAHIAGFGVLLGAILPLDLRLMGCWRAIPLATLARVLVPVAACGLVVAIGAGLMLFSIRAGQYATTPLFQVKMALVACGIANALLLRRAVHWDAAQAETGAMPPARLRIAGALSIAIWLAVLVCGRFIAFLF